MKCLLLVALCSALVYAQNYTTVRVQVLVGAGLPPPNQLAFDLDVDFQTGQSHNHTSFTLQPGFNGFFDLTRVDDNKIITWISIRGPGAGKNPNGVGCAWNNIKQGQSGYQSVDGKSHWNIVWFDPVHVHCTLLQMVNSFEDVVDNNRE